MEGRGKQEEKKTEKKSFFHTMFQGIPRGHPGPKPAISRFPRFRTEIISPGKIHLDREQPRPHCRE